MLLLPIAARGLRDRAHARPRPLPARGARVARRPGRSVRDRYEVVVVDDGPSAETRAVTQRAAERPASAFATSSARACPGLNSARNTGVAAGAAPFVVFVDDDVEAPAGWLRELLDGPPPPPRAPWCSAARSSCGSRARACGCAAARRRRSRRSTPGPRTARSTSCGAPTWAIDRRAFELAGMFDAGRPLRLRRGHVGAAAARARGDGDVRGARRARAPARCRDARAAAADARGLPARAQPARLHRAPRPGALGSARAARARRLRLAHLPLPLRQRPAADGALRRPRGRELLARERGDDRPGARALGRERDRRGAAAARASRGCATSRTTPPPG